MQLHKLDTIIPQTSNNFARGFGSRLLRLLGWRIVGQFPKQAKFVVAIAPHTSNWDFVIAVAAMLALQIKVRFLGKDAIFIWPFKVWLTRIGGIPVERSTSHGVVEQMVNMFDVSDKLVLAIAPEGTRRKTEQWKSGFLHIAHKAQVPVVPLSLDFGKKEIRVHHEMNIGGDIEQELVNIKAVFADIEPKNPQCV
jgi:1-acyl-sn-glycerol-3-phosphate acyltransferase